MSNTPSQQQASLKNPLFSLQKKKEGFLQFLYYGVCLLSLPAMAVSLGTPPNNLLIGVTGAVVAFLFLLTLIKIPYSSKATALLLFLYSVAMTSLLRTGMGGETILFFLSLITLSVLLFSVRIGLLIGSLSFGSIIAAGLLLFTGQISKAPTIAPTDNLLTWIIRSAILMGFSILIAIGINILQTEFFNLVEEENALLISQAGERASLEEKMQERSLALDRRSDQLEAAAFVTRAATEVHDLGKLLNIVVQQITDRFGFYHAGIFLADQANNNLALVAASSKGGQVMLARGHSLAIGREGLVGFAAYQKRSRVAQDVGSDAVYFNNPDLPETHSEIALPLLAQNHLIGVLDIQSREQNAFTPVDISTLQTMTDQIAMAIENIRLLEQSRAAIENLELLNEANTAKVWKERLGGQARGYSYTPLGLNPISATDLASASESAKKDSSPEKTIQVSLKLRGKEIGMISLKRKSNEAAWGETEKEMVQGIATQVVLAIENARLLEESQHQASREQLVNELSSRFSRSLDVDTLLQNAVREVHKLPQVSQVSIFINPAEETRSAE